MRVLLGCDPNGCPLKEAVLEALDGHEVVDLGEPGNYYEIAVEAARRVAAGQADRAVLLCGSGMGMAIMANKVRGVYAAVCETVEAARGARSVNNANVLAMGARVVDQDLARAILDAFLGTEFTEGFGPELQSWLRDSMAAIARLEEAEFAAR